MDEIPTQDFEQMAALSDRGVLTHKEFDTWCLRNFPILPGTRLTFHRTKAQTWDLAASDGTKWATCRGGSFTYFHQLWRSIKIQEEVYRWRGCGKTMRSERRTHELVVRSSSKVVLRMSGTHFNKRATTRVELVGQDTYTFPVVNAIMSAVDSSGTSLARYRLDPARAKISGDPRKKIEVVVDPKGSSTPGFDLVVAVSTLFLSRYFERPSGG